MLQNCADVTDMCSMSETAEVHETSFNTEISANTYYTYLFCHRLYGLGFPRILESS